MPEGYGTRSSQLVQQSDGLFKVDHDLEWVGASNTYGRELTSLDKTALMRPVMAQHIEAY